MNPFRRKKINEIERITANNAEITYSDGTKKWVKGSLNKIGKQLELRGAIVVGKSVTKK